MHKLNFFPIGNGDCVRIDLETGRQFLFDYAALRDPADPNDRRIDLSGVLNDDLASRQRDYYDVVAFTHLDDDHTRGSSAFFHLDHARKYQGEDRIKMRELWVPAAALTEDGCEDEARIIRTEARHRMREGYGVRVFSRPERLKKWLADQGRTLESRKHLITDAGQVVTGFEKTVDGVEFFVHSPFAIRQNDNQVVDRNADGLVLHATFLAGGRETKVLLTADVTWEEISGFVRMTRRRGNDSRLEWDVVDLPHHCSYRALGPEKGAETTEPVDDVEWLYAQGRPYGTLISPSCPIPSEDTVQPPHRQAANYYRGRARAISGHFVVTMEHPRLSAPKTLVIKIDRFGAMAEKAVGGGAASVVSQPAPRAGVV